MSINWRPNAVGLEDEKQREGHLTVKDETNSDGDIEIAIVGLRPGEKLYEELLIGNNPRPTQHPRIMKAHEEFIPWSSLEKELKALQEAIAINEVEAIRTRMQAFVTGTSQTKTSWIGHYNPVCPCERPLPPAMSSRMQTK